MTNKDRHIRILLCILAAGCFGFSVSSEQAYEPGGRRDPFVPLIGVHDPLAKGGIENITNIGDVDLQGIVVGADGRKSVILNGEVIAEGEGRGHVRVGLVGINAVIISINDESHELRLHK